MAASGAHARQAPADEPSGARKREMKNIMSHRNTNKRRGMWENITDVNNAKSTMFPMKIPISGFDADIEKRSVDGVWISSARKNVHFHSLLPTIRFFFFLFLPISSSSSLSSSSHSPQFSLFYASCRMFFFFSIGPQEKHWALFKKMS